MFTWDEKNCNIQSEQSNCYDDNIEMMKQYRERMIGKYGESEVERLEFYGRMPNQMWDYEKRELLKLRRLQCKKLLKEKMFIKMLR